MDSDELLQSQNVDDIIAQYDNDDDVDETTTEINVEMLLNDDLVSSALASPPMANNQESKPQLTSSLPAPAAPKTDTSHVPDLPSTVSARYNGTDAPLPLPLPSTQISIDEEVELDIETIINDSKMETDDLLHDNIDDALLEFDPDDITSTLHTSDDILISETNQLGSANNPTKYSDIDLESITSLIKREEIRMKQRMEVGNYVMIEPLTKRMMANATNENDDNSSDGGESFFKLELRENITTTLRHHQSEYGVPTVVKSHTKFIAMGMANGCVFIFDHFEQLRVELTCSDARALRMGSVTCLDFNYNGTLLIVGYHGGQLVLWDIINNRELKKIKDAHVSPITFVMFYRRGTLRIASCDSNGIMFTWSFTKIFFSYNVDRSTLFNGKRAGVLYDIALYKPQHTPSATATTSTTTASRSSIFDSLSLCAIANKESVFFVILEPPFTLKQTILLPNTSINELKRGALPMLSWRLAAYTSKGNKGKKQKERNNPVLAVGSGTVIQFIEIFIKDESQFYQTRDTSLIRMRGIGQIQLKKLVVALRWLNGENLILLTANDEILICAQPSGGSQPNWSVTETIWPVTSGNATTTNKITMHFFIRHQYFGKHIICFKHCFETIAGLDRTGQSNKLIITTASNIVSVHCMTWYDRIEKLIREGEWIKACCLIISFWNAYCANEIQASGSGTIQRLLGKLDAYILQFCEFVVQSSAISSDELESFGGVAMDYCVCLNKSGALLFDRVYQILLNNGGREIFFKLLEPYILNDRITTLPPEFMQKFADFLVSRDKIYELQQIILHLTPQSFDIHQIVSICRENELFIALCYLYNTACLDYAEPIRDMFYKIIKKQNQNYTVMISRGYQLILYLKYIMNGTTFPWCNALSSALQLKAKQQIFSVLFDESEQYQILRHLLGTDLKEVLFHIIKCGFDDKHLFRKHYKSKSALSSSSSSSAASSANSSPSKKSRRTSIQIRGMLSNAQSAVTSGAKWAWSLSAITSPPPPQHTAVEEEEEENDGEELQLDAAIELKSKQEMFNVLVDIIIYEMGTNESSIASDDNEIFYEFCTPLLASGECDVNIHLLKSVLQYLFCESQKLLNKIEKLTRNLNKQKKEKSAMMQREVDRLRIAWNNFENTILILLSRKMMEKKKKKENDFDVNSLLRMAKASKFHKVELYLHRECGNHSAVIDSYLADTDLESQVFDYLHNLFYDLSSDNDELIAVIKIVLKRLSKLIVISSQRSAELVFKWFAFQYFDETVNALSVSPHTQYIFLRQIVESMQSLKHKQNSDENDDLKLNNFERLLVEHGEFEFKRQHHELYIRLLCEFECESVLSYLSSNSDQFDIDLVARYCDKFAILDGSSYLRERSGDILGALQLILQSIAQRVNHLWDVFGADYACKPPKITSKTFQNNSYYISNGKIKRILDELSMAIGLCQRHQESDTNNANNDDVLWNNLLDSCLVSQQKITNDIKTPSFRQQYPSSEIRYLMKQVVNEIVTRTLTVMMTEKNIDLVQMFEKLVDKESSEKYEYYRDTIDVMLSTFKYETQMLKTANNLFRSGVHKEYKHHCSISGHAFENINHENSVCNLCHSMFKNVGLFRLRLFYCGHLFHQHCFLSLAIDDDDGCPICVTKKKGNHKLNRYKSISPLQLQRRSMMQQKHNTSMQNIGGTGITTQFQNNDRINYSKKLKECKQKLQYRETHTDIKHVPLQLAPKNKAMQPRSNVLNMHVPVANWQIMCQNNKRNACCIQID